MYIKISLKNDIMSLGDPKVNIPKWPVLAILYNKMIVLCNKKHFFLIEKQKLYVHAKFWVDWSLRSKIIK